MIIILILTALVLLTCGAVWFLYGLPGLVVNTHALADFCQSIYVRCIAGADLLGVIVLWAASILFAAGLSYGVYRCISGVVRARLALKRLPLKDCGGSVVLIRDAGCRTAFTYGCLNPRVYISTGLIRGLERDELRGVFLHELHHRRRKDPLKFLLAAFLRDTLFYLPAASDAVNRMRLEKEFQADDAAVSSMKEPVSLASALLKSVRFNAPGLAGPATFLTGGGGGRAIEGRVRRLVEGAEVKSAPIGFRRLFASVLVAGFMAASFVMPLQAGVTKKECSTDHCSVHINTLGAQCRAHCAAGGHKSRHHG